MRSDRSSRRALFGRALLVAAVAVVPVCGARGEKLELVELASPPIELTAPLAATELVGGGTGEIAWRPAAGFDALVGATEWEAFLSVDGGRSYPVRLTPHLALDRRRFVFRVPDLPSAEVRLLLRIGDERAERAVRLPTPLRIVRSVAPTPAVIEAALAAGPALAPGEPALAGGTGVLFWVDGDRDGSRLRHRAAAPLGAHSAADPILFAAGPKALGSDDSAAFQFGERPARATHPAAAEAPRFVVASAEPPTVSDILLLIQRQNE